MGGQARWTALPCTRDPSKTTFKTSLRSCNGLKSATSGCPALLTATRTEVNACNCSAALCPFLLRHSIDFIHSDITGSFSAI